MAGKRELIEGVAAATGLTKADAERAVNAVVDSIVGTCASGERLILKGFGSFSLVSRKATTANNPQGGPKIAVPAKKLIRFRASKDLGAKLS